MIQKANTAVEVLVFEALSATVVNSPVGTFDVVNKGYLDTRLTATDLSAQNIASDNGFGVYNSKSNGVLYFNYISAGENVTLRSNGSAIAIDTFISANGSDFRLATTTFTTSGIFTYNIPANSRALIIEVIGGGGGGGGGKSVSNVNSTTWGGAGGGGGSYSYVELDPSTLTTSTLTVSVAYGGTGGAQSGGTGTNGGASYVKAGGTILIYASGGYGGSLSTPGSGALINGGGGSIGAVGGAIGVAPIDAVGGGGGGGGAGVAYIGGGSQVVGTPAPGGAGGAQGGYTSGAQGNGQGNQNITTGGAGGGGGNGLDGNGYNGIFGGGGGGGGGGFTGGSGGNGGSGLVRIRACTTHAGNVPNTYSTGNGIDLFYGLSGGDSIFRTLVQGTGITITSAASTITISNPNTISNIGGQTEIAVGGTYNVRTLSATGNIALVSGTNVITISGGSSGTTYTNVGTGNQLVDNNSSIIRTLVAGTGVTLTSAASTITINSPLQNVVGIGNGIDLSTGLYDTNNNSEIRTLVAGTGVTLTSAASTVTINSPLQNAVGIGGGNDITTGLYDGSSNIELKTLVAGTGVTITSAVDKLTFSSPLQNAVGIGGGNDLTTGLYDGSNNIELRTLVAGTGVSIISSASSITIAASISGGAGYNNVGGAVELVDNASSSIRTLSAGPGIILLSSAQLIAISASGSSGGSTTQTYRVRDIAGNIVELGRGAQGPQGVQGTVYTTLGNCIDLTDAYSASIRTLSAGLGVSIISATNLISFRAPVTLTGPYSAMPSTSSSFNGDVYKCTDSPYEFVFSNNMWTGFVDGYNVIVPPPISSFSTTLVNTISTANTSITVAANTLSAAPFIIQIDSEYLYVTANTGTTWTVTRAYNGTTAAAHTSGATVTLRNWIWPSNNPASGRYSADTNRGVLHFHALSGSDNTIPIEMPLPVGAPPWTVIAGFKVNSLLVNYMYTGIVCRNSTANTLVRWMILIGSTPGGELFADTWTSPTAGEANVNTFTMMGADTFFLKLVDDGTNRLFYYSRDLFTWTLLYSHSRTLVTTPDRVGFICAQSNTTYSNDAILYHWSAVSGVA